MKAERFIGAITLLKGTIVENNHELAQFLRCLEGTVPIAQTREGQNLLDASDFRAWLRELAEETEKAA